MKSRKIQSKLPKYQNSLNLLLSQNFTVSSPKLLSKITELAFETLEVANFQFTSSASNIMYSNGLSTGLVIDMGESSTSLTPIYEGFIMSHAAKRTPIGGRAVLNNLISLLA